MNTYRIFIAAFFLVASVVIWFVMLRPVPHRTAVGLIKRKTHKPEGAYWQYQAGERQGFRVPTKITIAEAYVLEIDTPDIPQPVYALVNMGEERAYEVGDQVEIKYIERSLPLIWRKQYITDIGKSTN